MKPILSSAAAIIAPVSLVLLAAACGGSSSTGSGTSSRTEGSANSQALAFSGCMRSHGVLNFADPNSSGELPKETPQQLGVSSSQLRAAQTACQHLLSNGLQPTQAELQQSWSDTANFARCMRSHGVPNWPDPTGYPQHPDRPTFNLQPVDIEPNSPPINSTVHTCEPLLHGVNPQHLGEGGS